MKILITGSEGKIGKELVKILGDNELLLIDKRGGNSIKCNLAYDDLSIIESFAPEIIIHLAASFERTDESPQFHRINYEDNILASYRLIKCVSDMKHQIKQFIFASSYLVYDSNLYLSSMPLKYPKELSESDAIMPRNLIGAAKLYIENEIDFMARNVRKDMLVTHARIFRVFGEGGQEFVSRIIEWKKIGLPVDIWKPENRFDYIHTSDCASAIKSLINVEGIFNVGYGVSTKIKDILEVIKPVIRHISKDDLYEASCADTNYIEERTGWTPKINVIDWIKTQL